MMRKVSCCARIVSPASAEDNTVLTKVGVYSGIGFIATTAVPMLFERFERRLLAPA
jgi:hypothetical protein